MTTDKMILNIKSNVAYITFNNPEKHNAVSLDMWDSLEEMLNQCEKDHNVRVVVLNGAGGKMETNLLWNKQTYIDVISALEMALRMARIIDNPFYY